MESGTIPDNVQGLLLALCPGLTSARARGNRGANVVPEMEQGLTMYKIRAFPHPISPASISTFCPASLSGIFPFSIHLFQI